MNMINLRRMAHFALRWSASVIAAIVLSNIATLAHAASPKTISFVLDNDILVPSSRDQDYTGGLNLNYVAEDVSLSAFYLETPLDAVDAWLDIDQSADQLYGIEVGLYGFTPENTKQEMVNNNDRPYSSLIYLSSTHERVDIELQKAWQTRLTIGWLGLDIFENLQKGVHNLTASKQPKGWHHQISDGGEPTFRYQLSHQKALLINSKGFELKYSKQLSLGYITEAGLSLSGRYGRFNSSWWNFNPAMSSYGEQRNSLAGNRGESFVYFGAAIKYRVYNAFLQGQFRQSDRTLRQGELNHLLAEVWAGYTQSFSDGYQLSYIIRAQSSEIKNGIADRSLIWGGLSLSKTFY